MNKVVKRGKKKLKSASKKIKHSIKKSAKELKSDTTQKKKVQKVAGAIVDLKDEAVRVKKDVSEIFRRKGKKKKR